MPQLWEFLVRSGPLIIPILAASVVVLGLVIERIYFWLGLAMRKNVPLRQELLQLKIDPKRVSKAGDPVAVILYEYLRRPFDLEGAKKKAEAYLRETRRFHGAIQLFAGLSTSLGLFGTVFGVAQSFEGFDKGAFQAVIGGLHTALNTTIAGLIVYIFGTLWLALFESMSVREKELVEDGMNRVREALLDRQRSKQRASGGDRQPVLEPIAV